MTPRAPDAGVTLIEMLVALAISALIGVAGFAMLDGIVRMNDRAEADLTRLNALDRAFLVIGRDLAGADPRQLRVEGSVLRSGRKIEYRIEGDTLERHIVEPGLKQRLLADVRSAEWRVFDRGGTAHADWPPAGDVPDPVGVGLVLDAGEIGSVERVFALPDGPP